YLREGRLPSRPSSSAQNPPPNAPALSESRRKRDADRTTNGHRLVHQPEEESTHVRVVADNTERLARARRDPRGAREQNKFLPEACHPLPLYRCQQPSFAPHNPRA